MSASNDRRSNIQISITRLLANQYFAPPPPAIPVSEGSTASHEAAKKIECSESLMFRENTFMRKHVYAGVFHASPFHTTAIRVPDPGLLSIPNAAPIA